MKKFRYLLKTPFPVLLLWFSVVPISSSHLLYDGSGNFLHPAHFRDLGLYNESQGSWYTESRNAHLSMHSKMNGSLRFTSTSHANSVIHILNQSNYGATEWIGATGPLTGTWSRHEGHVHVRFNTYYSTTAERRRKTSCHELGHSIGLDHSDTAGDCMISGAVNNLTLESGHIDQVRSAWTNSGH